MRYGSPKYRSNKTSHRHSAQTILKAVLFVLLFTLIFTSIAVASAEFNFADAATRTGKPLSVSSTSSTNLLSKYNTYNSSYLADFYIDADMDTAAANFKWHSGGRGYGWENFAAGDKAFVYWLQIDFTGDLLTAAKEGRVSYYASANATFGGDFLEADDENAMAVSYVGTNAAPTASFVGSSRSGNSASWNTSYTGRMNSYSSWINGSGTHTLGHSGSFNSSYASKSTTTGIRLIFAVIGDSDCHGGFKNFNLTLYVKPKDEITSTGTTFSLTNGLYGEEYKIQANSTSNWGTEQKVSSLGDMQVVGKVNFAANANIKSSLYSGLSVDFGTLEYPTAGLFAGLGNSTDPSMEYYTDMTVTLPKGVTKIDFAADLFAASYVGTSHTTDWATVSVELLKDTSAITNGKSELALGSKTGGTNHTSTKSVNLNNLTINTSATTSNTTLTVRLRLKAGHPNYTGNAIGWGSGDDRGNAFGLIGNIKIKMYGAYYVSFNANGAPEGTMTNQTLRYGIKDTTETLKSNAFTYPDHTFVGWATSSSGSVVYSNGWDSSAGALNSSGTAVTTSGAQYVSWQNELTNVPGATVTLYAVWRENDFGRLPNGTGKWGSSTNPYVIEDRDHWLSLVDIVNKNRDPVDSVSGTYYGNTISSADVQASYTTFYGCYFVILNDIDLGLIDPVGIDTATSNASAKNFRGTIYGGSGAGVKVNRTLTLNISTDNTDEEIGTGLFGCFTYGTIEYITVAGNIASTTGRVGGIVGQTSSSGYKYIRNCTVKANINGITYNTQNEVDGHKNGVGGIVGYTLTESQNVIITDCSYEGGTTASYTLSNNGGTVRANLYGGNGVGGIVGYMPSASNKIKISGCTSSGTIVGQMNVGGIAGRVESTNTAADAVNISNVYNTASVEAKVSSYTVGGIVGYFYYNGSATANAVLTINYAYNSGAVKSAGNNAGGIVGKANVGTNGVAANVVLSNCYNDTTAITGTAATTNAIVGDGTNTVENCWSFSVQATTSNSTADFSSSRFIGINNSNAKGNFFAVAYTGASILPSDGDANSTDVNYNDWKNITELNIENFRATGSISNGDYLRVYNAGASNTPLVSPTASIVEPWKYNVVFASGTSVNRLAIARAAVTLEKTSDSKIYDNLNAPALSNWALRATSGTLKNNYTTSLALQYSADGGKNWVSYTAAKDVLYNGNTVKAYDVKITFYNGTGKIVGVRILSGAFTINPRQIDLVANWINGIDNSKSYIYNANSQGLNNVSVISVSGIAQSGKISTHTFSDLFDVADGTNVAYAFNADNIAVDEDTVNIGTYSLALILKNKNYSYSGTLSWTWKIEKKSISNPTNFVAADYDIYFGYGPNGAVSGSYEFNADGNSLFALDMKSFGSFFTENDSPYALVYKDNNSVYNSLNSYNLLFRLADGGYYSLVRGVEYSVEMTFGGNIDDQTLSFNAGQIVEVTLVFSGVGNFGGERIIRFTLMESDFGGNYAQADWGSESNPYLIEHEAHLVRLAQIVNGSDKAWNSINNTEDAYQANSYAKAKDRTYQGTYFFLTENVGTSTAGGFRPIGRSAQNYFGASFDGEYNGSGHTITLDIAERGEDYVGLFGYMKGATVANVSVSGSIVGRDYVGAIAGFADETSTFIGRFTANANVTGRNFVGGIGGRIDTSLGNATNTRGKTVSGRRAVGGIVGYFRGAQLSDALNEAGISHLRSDSAPYSVNGTVFDVLGEQGGIHAVGGIVGLIDSMVTVADCRNNGRITAVYASAVGGLVGYASVDSFEISILGESVNASSTTVSSGHVLGGNYVGGIVGYANNVVIDEDCIINANVTGGFNYTGGSVTAANLVTESGYAMGNYVGGVAGKWVVHDSAQMTRQRRVQNNITIAGVSYVGGLVGWLDASDSKGLVLSPFITNGIDSPLSVIGKSYVGALYGGFEGYGYKRNSQNESKDDTAIYITSENEPGTTNPLIYVEMTLLSGGSVAGGLIGYASGTGIFFLGNWTGLNHTPFTFYGTPNTSFFGGIIGVLGENAIIGSAEQLSANGDYTVLTQSHVIQYRNASSSSAINIGGDFVGSIAGYIASTAGTYLTSDTTFMGNTVQLFNRSRITANGFVGGLFGAAGRIPGDTYQVSGDEKLSRLLQYGRYDLSTDRTVNNTLRYAPADSYGAVSGGLGKLFNYQAITGKGNYVGGIIGYVGEGALFALVNSDVDGTDSDFNISDAKTYLNVYNGNDDNPASGNTANISGANYVGGIAGWVSSMSHEFIHIVSLMRIIGTGSSSVAGNNGANVGGIVGYMNGGTLDGCIATSGFTTSSNGVNAFQGGENVGGLVGMLAGGSVLNSVSRGFNYTNVDSTRGGVVGRVGTGTTINASWTFYIVAGSGLTNSNVSPNYSTVSLNRNGKYVVVDSRLVSANMVPSFSEYAKMVGLFVGDGVNLTMQATEKGVNDAKEGYLSIKTHIPSASVSLKNMQLVFYNVSGSDKNTENEFDTISSDVTFKDLIAQNGQMYYRFDMVEADSFLICVVPIEFKNVPTCSSTSEEVKKKNAQDKYQKPASQDDRYIAEVVFAEYDTVTHNLISLGANIKYKNGNGTPQIIGSYVNENIDVGTSETPYIISNQTDWNTLADHVNGTKRILKDGKDIGDIKFIKLATDIVVVTGGSNNPFMGKDANNYFNGTFDGNGHSITIKVTGSSTAGLSAFPYAGGATFRNLTVKGDITTTAENAAGFVAKPSGNLQFYNCTNETNINAKRTAGGIVGFTNGYTVKLVTCVNKGNIETDDPVESDADHSGKDSMYSSSNKYYKALPDFNNYTYGTGGIIGYATNTITIESCKNEGSIRAGYNVGGILGQNDAETHIYNCANIGSIHADAYWKDEATYLQEWGGGTYRMTYAGGIVGKIGQNGWLEMLACYNTASVIGWGPVVGGLAGSVGYLLMDGADTGIAGGKSLIAYCYNTGEVKSGGSQRLRQNEDEHSSEFWKAGREELNGSIIGGIVGFIAWGDVNYCYNTGQITTFRIIGYAWVWQSRIGGIAGQAQPSASNYSVNFNYCYNLGLLYVYSRERNGYLDAVGALPYWGGGICGYLDKNDCQDRLTSSYCYTIENFMHAVDVQRNTDDWASDSIQAIGSGDVKRYVIGTLVSDVGQLTAYMSNSGSLTVDRSIGSSISYQAASLIDRNGDYLANYNENTQSVTYSSAFKNGTAYGYLYIYGCLPQLAVFALDTKEGLSMLSVSYGKNEYDEYVGSIAGSKESPYVIKDGVGLLAMSALTGARSNSGSGTSTGYFTFKDKYIEFADGTNNIENMTAKSVNMTMDNTSSSLKSGKDDTTTYNQNGKNYFLFEQGAVSGRTSIRYGSSPVAASTLRTNWYTDKNNYYAMEGAYTKGLYYSTYANFYPIGRNGGASAFMGSMSGEQAEGANTEVRGLRISQYNATNSYAGLFGSVYNAEISNITVDGTIRAYTNTSASGRSFVGGIAGYAGGDSVIRNCNAGREGALLTVYAFANSTAVKSFDGNLYAGGIVGAAGPKRNSAFADTVSRNTVIENCKSVRTNVYSAKNHAGGIVGFVGDPWSNTNLDKNNVTLKDVYVDRSAIGVNSTYAMTSNAETGTDIGGIVGTNDGNVICRIEGAYVGKLNTAYTVSVSGENSVGGVIGSARGNVEISNAEITEKVNITRTAFGNAQNVSSAEGLYFTSIGGIIGRTISGQSNTLRDVITFMGNIVITVATDGELSNPTANPVANVGGVIGSMGAGTSFLGGSIVTVGGTITTDSKSGSSFYVKSARNIGGVVGATIDGAFDGYFDIHPTINSTNATNVGGFIGRNFGTANILASNTSVKVDGVAYTGTVININGTISGKSEVGGLVGINGYVYADGTAAGYLRIGADSYNGTVYSGKVIIAIGGKYKGDAATGGTTAADMFDILLDSNNVCATSITATEDNVGGIVGSNIVLSGDSNDDLRGLLIRKGIIYNFANVGGNDNVGGVVGNNEGDIEMGGSEFENAALTVVNGGNVSGRNHVGGTVGYLQLGTIAGTFANIGNVEGKQYVGGSVGRVDSEAVLTVGATDTYFFNGEESGSQYQEVNDDALVAADAVIGGQGNVKGEKYVGGSIGAIFGTIRGNAYYSVKFYNIGNVTGVNGANFVGGNIGMLAGSVSNAEFANSGRVTSDGSDAIGGSVGFIGKADEITAAHKEITVANVHFDFTGDNNIEVSGSSTEVGGGVGGAVGVIAGADNDFDNSDGAKWQNVTLYTANGVSAPNVCNVGGAIGIIKADNILISNMLAFYTSVRGKSNVGGIVGAVTGRGVKVLDSFNIEGNVDGTTAGGIIGASIKGDTDASTSYWVKGYTNEELMALNIYDIVNNLGKYEVAKLGNTVFTQELTEDYGTVANFLGDEKDERSWSQYLNDVTGHPVQLINGVWAYDKGSTAVYTTGAEGGHTGWYYVYANNRKGLDATHSVAPDSNYPSILGDAASRENELAYWKRIANAYTAQELVEQRDKALLISGIVAKVDGTTVTGSTESPREGIDENGDYIVVPDEQNIYAPKSGSIYASALASTVSGYYLYMDATGEKPTIWHATNSDGTRNPDAPFYITANTHTANNVVVYYRAVGIGGTLTYNGYDRYVPITDEVSRVTDESGTTETQYIEYVSDFDAEATGTSGNYVYTMDSVRKKDGSEIPAGGLYEEGTYLVDVSIYYYDSFGKPAKIGGINSDPDSSSDDDKLRINRFELGVSIVNKDEKYNGKNTNAEVVLTIDGIAPLDKELRRAVIFALGNGDSDTVLDDIYKIEGKLNISELLNAEKIRYSYDEAAESRTLYPLGTTRMYLAGISQEFGKDLELKNINSDSYLEKGWKITITFKFTDSFEGSVKAGIVSNEGESSHNYKCDDVETPIKVEPQELKIVVNRTSYPSNVYAFNGGMHDMQFNFEGWVDDDGKNSSAFIAQLMPSIVYVPVSGTNVESLMYSGSSNKTILTPVSTDKYLVNWNPNGSIVRADNLRDLGTYEIHFGTQTYFNGLPATDDRNYYLSADSVIKGEDEYADSYIYEFCKIVPNEFTLDWDEDPVGTYNSQTHAYGVTLTAKDAFDNVSVLKEEIETIFAGIDFEFGFTVEAIDESTAKVTFAVGPNVKDGGYTVSVPRGESDNCAFAQGTELSGKCTILPLDVTIGLSGTTNAVYNGGFHEIQGGITAVADNPDADPQTSFNSASGVYTLSMFDGMLASNQTAADNQVRVTLIYAMADGTKSKTAVNVGEYGAEIESVTGSKNFNVTYDNGSGSVIITSAHITLLWGSTREWTYDRLTHGISLGGNLTNPIEGMSLTSTYNMSSAETTISVKNASANTETLKITLGGTPSAVNAGNYTAYAKMDAITISGSNAAGSVGAAQLGNYEIEFVAGQTAENGTYRIKQRQVSVTGMRGNIVTKIYDATASVPSSSVGTPVFNDTIAPSVSSCTVSAVYNNALVGTNKTITYTITITGADAANYDFTTGTDRMTFSVTNGVINARQLVVRLDRLRNGAATRVYDGYKWYGGADGAVNVSGKGTAVSAVSRSGEGFTVSNFATADISGSVVITAQYAEATAGRVSFDAYVNNVIGSGSDVAIGPEHYGDSDYRYKKLVFSLSGSAASNYNFIVLIGNSTQAGDKTGNSSASGAVTVNDGYNGGASGLKIEITAYTLKAEYRNTAQSYANADNTYNMDWNDVTGDAAGVRDDDKLAVAVVNNWKYENNNANGNEIPAVYKSYTVIRGASGSNILSAKLTSSGGAHINYQLSNQPVLTIGYFIDREEFEIASIAGLMIATYYYSVGKNGNDEFGTIISQANWRLVASNDMYESGIGYPTANEDGSPFTDADGNEIVIRSWDEYFAYLESEAGGGRYVFLNQSEGENSGWGYYYVDENSMPTSYDKFRQIANVSGVLTAQDIAILDGMFLKTTYDGDGNVIEEKSYDWGVGGQYLTNFVKSGVGNVVTAIDSVFTGVFDGIYDGNGYVIDGLNIVGNANGGDNYYGMFGRISACDGAVADVTNVHLRNINITVGGSGTVYVGGIAGESAQDGVHNISVHGSIDVSVNGTAYVGGIYGLTSATVDGAISLGNINVKAASANVGGIIGRTSGASVSNAVSLMQIRAEGSGVNVYGLVGDGTTVGGTSVFMRYAVWKNGAAISGGISYSDLYGGSISGYSASNPYYYTEETPNSKGAYDVLDDVRLTALDGDELSRTNPHESMRLSDIIDIYVLMYAKQDATTTVEGRQVAVFSISDTSPLVGNRHGTDADGDAIVIANQQGVALMRELRFATFELVNDVYMYSTYQLRTAKGAFFGKVIANGFGLYIRTWDGATAMFETETVYVGYATPTQLIKAQ